MTIREAEAGDSAALARLFALLGHHLDPSAVRERLSAASGPTLVAERGGEVVGACGLAIGHFVHRPYPVGRITVLVVDERHRGAGVGRALLAQAEERLRQAGCRLVEITSNRRLSDAHSFYRHVGYEATSERFARPLLP